MSPDELKVIQNDLFELSKSKKPSIRALVASNPYTPVSILIELSSKEKDYEVKGGLAQNPNTPEAILRGLAKSKSLQIKRALAENPNTPSDVLLAIAKGKVSPYDNRILLALTENKAATFEVLSTVNKAVADLTYDSYRNEVLTKIIVHPNCSKDLQTIILSSTTVPTYIVEDDTTQASSLDLLLTHLDQYLAPAMAKHPNCPLNVLLTLANSSDYEDAHYALLLRETLPIEVIQVLVKNPKIEIRIKALEHLAKIEGATGIQVAALTPYTPPPMNVFLSKEEVLEELIGCGNEEISQSAMAAKSQIDISLIEDSQDIEFLCKIAFNDPSITSQSALARNFLVRQGKTDKAKEIGVFLAKSPSREVRVLLRANSYCPEVFTELAKDSDPLMKHAIVNDPYSSQEAIQILARDPDPKIRLAAAVKIQNPVKPKPEEVPIPKAPLPEEKSSSYTVPALITAGLFSVIATAMKAPQTRIEVSTPLLEEAIETVKEASA